MKNTIILLAAICLFLGYDALIGEGKTNEVRIKRNQILSELMCIIDSDHADYERLMLL